MVVKLHPHQEQAVQKLKNGSILWGGTGSGKSITAVAYYMSKEVDRDVYVITTAKKRDDLDWEAEFVKYGVGSEPGATTGGILTVDSWNNISKYSNVYGAFFIFDEQRLVGSGAWVKAFLKIARRNRWILLSATPGDTWMDYVPVFVANGFYENRTQFKREHVVYNPFTKFPKVERFLNVARLINQRNQILVEMPYLKHTTTKTTYVPVFYDEELFKKAVDKLWHVYEERPLRTVSELFLVMRRVVNSHPSRLDAVRNLLLSHSRLIVFYNFDFELTLLRSIGDFDSESLEKVEQPDQASMMLRPSVTSQTIGLKMTKPATSMKQDGISTQTNSGGSTLMLKSPDHLTVAEWNGHRHDPLPTSERWLYLVQYAAGSEGWNCTSTDAMCFYSLTYSYKQWHQAYGRTDRLNTLYQELYYYVLMSNSLIDRAIMQSLRDKRNFNESSFAEAGNYRTQIPEPALS